MTTDLPQGTSGPALRALASLGIESVADCARFSKAELLAQHGMGPKAIRLIGEALAERSLSFKILDGSAG